MQEIRNRADCYIKGEESNAEKRERSIIEGSITQKSGKEQGHSFQQTAWAKKGYDNRGRIFHTRTSWDDHRRPNPVSGYGMDSLTPLNTSRARILKEVYQSELIRLPPQAEGPKGPDMNKWLRRGKADEARIRDGTRKAQGRRDTGMIDIRRAEEKMKSEE
ncbi:gag-pol polyprotein [Sesbania bispinosa]|nr:gag-pol polyprotein [Sesbania bispinosa]